MERFEEWFAVRVGHGDDEFWPSRLVYDPDDGISLDAINFSGPEFWYSNPTFSGETITGYIDYQRPATILAPFIQSANPGTIGADTPFCRARYRVVGNGILKGVHLRSLSEKCFTGLSVELPSFHAWVSPQLARSDHARIGELPSVSVEVDAPSRREFQLSGGAHAEVIVYASAYQESGDVPVRQHTLLLLTIHEAVDYERIMRMAAAADILFAFLIGIRLESAIHRLPTTRTRHWNNADETVTAEAWIVPAWKRAAVAPHEHGRLFVETNTPISVDCLLNQCISAQDDLTYLMNMVLASEMRDIASDDCFIELLGCLEAFDRTRFGSGADAQIRSVVRQLRELVETHGDESEKAVWERISGSFRNEYSLRRRLERLMETWIADGFRGRPNISRIVQLRNLKPHGRGHELSPEIFREMAMLLPFLCALARYHVLKVLGFDRASIASGFMRVAHRYGCFIPAEFIPRGT